MVKVGLQIKANLSNITKFYPGDLERFGWSLKVKCTGCGEENENWHVVSADVNTELTHSTVNFLYKCKLCSRENTLNILTPLSHEETTSKKGIAAVYCENDDDQFKTIIGFECRGLEPIDYEPRDGWTVTSNKKLFTNVNLGDGDWCEYNDLDNVPVELNNLTYKFVTIK